MTSKIPIIILNWNGISDTEECLNSLMEQSYQDFEIFLVDNASKGEEPQKLASIVKDNPKVKLILNSENLGFTRGNNRIMEEVIARDECPPYLILLNNDTTVEPDWLKNLIKGAQREHTGMVSSKMIDYFNRERIDNTGHLMLNTGEIISKGHLRNPKEYTQSSENIGACGGGVLYSSAMLKDIGIFDEFFDTGYEDAELGLRAIMAGYKCWYEPTAIVYHKMGQSISKIFNQKYVLKIWTSTWYTYFKLVPMGAILLNLPFMILKYLGVLLLLTFSGKFQMARTLILSIVHTFRQNRTKISLARKAFKKQHRKLGSFGLLKKQQFFLFYDLKRFWRLFISRDTKMFEKYDQ